MHDIGQICVICACQEKGLKALPATQAKAHILPLTVSNFGTATQRKDMGLGLGLAACMGVESRRPYR